MTFNITDVSLMFVLLIFVGMGGKDGFIHTLGRLLGAILGFILARSWSSWLAAILGVFLPIGWARVIAFLALFLIINRLMGYALTIVDGIFRFITILPFLKSVDLLLGAAFGFSEAIVLLGGMIYLITTFKPVPSLFALANASKVAQWIMSIFHTSLSFLFK